MWWTTPKKGSCEKAKQWEFALHVLKMIPEAKLQANIISYSSAISACQRLGLLCRDVMSRDLNMLLCWFCWTICYFCCCYFNLAVRLPWCCDTLCQHVCHHGVVETTHTNRHHHHHHHFFCDGNSGVCIEKYVRCDLSRETNMQKILVFPAPSVSKESNSVGTCTSTGGWAARTSFARQRHRLQRSA